MYSIFTIIPGIAQNSSITKFVKSMSLLQNYLTSVYPTDEYTLFDYNTINSHYYSTILEPVLLIRL